MIPYVLTADRVTLIRLSYGAVGGELSRISDAIESEFMLPDVFMRFSLPWLYLGSSLVWHRYVLVGTRSIADASAHLEQMKRSHTAWIAQEQRSVFEEQLFLRAISALEDAIAYVQAENEAQDAGNANAAA